MKREIRIHKTAEKFMQKTDKTTFIRISEALENLADIPPVGDIKALSGKDKVYRARVGKYRIIFTLTTEAVLVLDIDSRGQIYKKGE